MPDPIPSPFTGETNQAGFVFEANMGVTHAETKLVHSIGVLIGQTLIAQISIPEKLNRVEVLLQFMMANKIAKMTHLKAMDILNTIHQNEHKRTGTECGE